MATLGFDPLVEPLLTVRPLPQAAPELGRFAALVFTSANGVAAFAALTPDRTRPVFAVGDATAAAARTAGFERVQSARGDLDRLAAHLLTPGTTTGPLLVPGALEPAGDLPVLLAGRVEAVALPVYEAVETGVPAPKSFDAVLVHSLRAARALSALGPFAGQRVAVLSAAVAVPLAARPDLEIRTAATPDEAALFAALGNPARRV